MTLVEESLTTLSQDLTKISWKKESLRIASMASKSSSAPQERDFTSKSRTKRKRIRLIRRYNPRRKSGSRYFRFKKLAKQREAY
jgi:hypothetical protein